MEIKNFGDKASYL